MRFATLRLSLMLLALVLIPLAATAECDCLAGGDDDGGGHSCVNGEWHQPRGDTVVTELTIIVEADSPAAEGRTLELQLRDAILRTIDYVDLAGPHSGRHTYSYEFQEPLPACDLKQAVLVNDSDVTIEMSYFKVVGKLTDGDDWLYFEKSCPGVVIGEQGCPRLLLYDR